MASKSHPKNSDPNSYSYANLIVDVLIWFILLPILAPIVTFFYLYKNLIYILASVFRKDLSPISSNDFMVARESLQKKQIVDIGFILKIQGEISIIELRRKFTQCFLNGDEYENYRSLYSTLEVYFGYMFFKRVGAIRVDEQISQDYLGRGKAKTAQEYFSVWFHSPYQDAEAPRWEMRLLHDEGKGESYVGFRMHHGLIDGFGMLLIVDKLCGQESPYLVAPEAEKTLMEKFLILLGLPREVTSYWIRSSLSSWPLSSIKNVDKSDRMFLSWTTLDLDQLKTIRRMLGVSFSSLLYVLQTGALRRYLIAAGRQEEITESLPVFHTIPKPNHPRTKLTNHWTFVKLHTPFSDPNPLSRVLKTERLYDEFMKTQLPVSGPMFFIAFTSLLPVSMCLLNLPTALSSYKASLSSMVRAPVQYKLFGKNCSNIYHTFCTKDLCPLTILYTTTASHNKQIDITFAGAVDLVGNQEGMNQMAEIHVQEEFQDLLNKCKNFVM